MAAIITSNMDTDEELREQFKNWGSDVIVQGTDSKEATPPEGEKKPSETTGEPGDKIAAEPVVETEADSETVETQETPEGESEEGKKKAKGGFQRKIEEKTAKIAELRDELEEERGDKTRLRQRLEAAEAELKVFKGDKPPVEEAPKGPVRPKRPVMPQLGPDFDYEKFATEQKQYIKDCEIYDDAMVEYFDTVADTKAEAKVQVERNRQAVEREQFVLGQKIDAGVADYPDYWDIYKRLPEKTVAPTDKSEAVQLYIEKKSKHPAALFRYLMLDYLDNDGEEGKRIAAMDDFDQVLELKDIETRLAQERAAKKPVEKKPEAPKETPVTPKPVMRKVPDAPIETVGGRGTGPAVGDLMKQYQTAADAGNHKEAFRLLKLLDKQSLEAKQRR